MPKTQNYFMKWQVRFLKKIKYLLLLLNNKAMNLIIKIVVTAILVMLIATFIPGIHVAGFTTALIVAVVLGLLNVFIKPILVVLTLPATLFTLGLFLLVINAVIILLCANIVGGFRVDSFWTALLFSIILSVLQSIMYKLLGNDK